MGSGRQPVGQTHQRLLEAACGLFAAKGYRNATVAEVCRQAGANIAAVNYHFGSKAALYRESWRHAHRRMLHLFPPEGGVGPDEPAERRLRGRIRSLLQRAMSDDSLAFRIMGHETANPTGLLGPVVRDALGPLRRDMGAVIAELLGGSADELAVRLCVTSVIGPCMQIMRQQRLGAPSGLNPPLGPDILEYMVEHFTQFALAGIRQTRRRLESGSLGGPSRPGGNGRRRL